jgi:DNA-binding response OmpR family regulator
MRLFVLDESRLLAWTVAHLAPPGTEVVGFTSFDEARRAILERAPDGLVVALTSAHIPLRELCALCAERTPPVPVLCGSPVFETAEGAGLDPASGAALFLHTPAAVEAVSAAIATLLQRAREAQCGAERAAAGAASA